MAAMFEWRKDEGGRTRPSMGKKNSRWKWGLKVNAKGSKWYQYRTGTNMHFENAYDTGRSHSGLRLHRYTHQWYTLTQLTGFPDHSLSIEDLFASVCRGGRCSVTRRMMPAPMEGGRNKTKLESRGGVCRIRPSIIRCGWKNKFRKRNL